MSQPVDPRKAHEDFMKQVQKSPPASASKGAWVTLHLLESVGPKTVLGYMTGAENGMLKLTKFVTREPSKDTYQWNGLVTTIHDGVWLLNPMHVWMIEHEKIIPTPGFTPYQE